MSIILTHGNILGQGDMGSIKILSEYLCERLVTNYQQGEIESPMFGVGN
jgi:hypothetical protein